MSLAKQKRFETFTAKQVQVVLDGISTDRNRHAWHMALAGMRRGEIAGQRWADVDFTNKLIHMGLLHERVTVSVTRPGGPVWS